MLLNGHSLCSVRRGDEERGKKGKKRVQGEKGERQKRDGDWGGETDASFISLSQPLWVMAGVGRGTLGKGRLTD